MSYFNRVDVCEAYMILESDYNVGGWLRERPSNQRRMESIDVQLLRMKFKPRFSLDGRYERLTPNGKEIYHEARARYGLPYVVKPRNEVLVKVREAIRHPYAWPGGYPVYVVLSDGERLHAKCARENYKQISAATRENARDGWKAIGTDVFWEGAPELCPHCNEEIESAYGDPDAEEDKKV